MWLEDKKGGIQRITFDCIVCNKTILGHAKYHQWFVNGKLVGYRHRYCKPKEIYKEGNQA